jgi:putative tryptophan/tyrosine transport system substrate-binding protein
MMERRRFLLTSLVGVLAAPLAAEAQAAAKVPLIGFVVAGSRSDAPLTTVPQPRQRMIRVAYLSPDIPNPAEASSVQGFLDAAKALGYSQGSNLTFEQRHADDRLDRLPSLAREIVSLQPDVIMTLATPLTQAAKRATDTIPIVMVAVGDPLGLGFVKSLNRPGGNITGLALNNVESAAKRLQFLKEAVPKLARVSMLANAKNPSFTALHVAQTRAAAKRMDIAIELVEVLGFDRLGNAFVAITKQHADGIIIVPDAGFGVHRERIAKLALQHRLPLAAEGSGFAVAGGLLGYGTSTAELYKQAARFVDRIVKGATPADIPVEQPTKFELVINLKTAKALGLTIPPSLLARADQVIEQ